MNAAATTAATSLPPIGVVLAAFPGGPGTARGWRVFAAGGRTHVEHRTGGFPWHGPTRRAIEAARAAEYRAALEAAGYRVAAAGLFGEKLAILREG